ncbi:IclR family transcriptional regulator [Streptomyces camelliae]|uniref:Helix-turn-helix domain-containing protein n=1 Tax=Streptomyces camelliae TaxID=3004093 RepID=A0ABY7PD56_9ACTN|nr:IclR family transcriptional regulator C-terminal domain-containing protein [Streptomyces sp. HUAS 2-6]WBO68540.1 helix-turn-helix domain-containing protein [Streptomyces sp. HUAS 2-6]
MSNESDGRGPSGHTDSSHRPESPVQSVDRATAILELPGRQDEAGVTEIAAELGVHKSTASRLATALELRGLIEQTEERGKYRLGLGLIRLAGAATVRLDLSRQSRPVREQLAAQVAEAINIAILRTQPKSARTDGCAYSVGELETGLNAVAAPVFTFTGQVVAALSASGPSFRLTEQRLPEVGATVRAAAEKISSRLGHLGRP